MASVSITNQTLTMTITIDGVDTVIRKDNCKVQAFGDVVRITDYKGSIYEFLYSDCTSPSEANANDLRDAIEEFLNTGGGGGGGGIESVTGDSVDNTDPNNPIVNAIPLSGTAEGAPLTGNIIAQNPASIRYVDSDEVRYIGYNADAEFGISISNSVAGSASGVGIAGSGGGVNFFATDGTALGNIGLTLNTGQYEFSLIADKIGVFDKSGTPSAQAAAIANATNATDVITQLNTLLAAMRAYGLIAE